MKQPARSISSPPWKGCLSFAGLPPALNSPVSVRIKKCLAQDHNTMFPARARTRTPRSEDERTNHEAIAPTKSFGQVADNWIKKSQSSSWPTAPGWTNHFIATSILPWIWQCAELNFPAPKPKMHLLIQFWKKKLGFCCCFTKKNHRN